MTWTWSGKRGYFLALAMLWVAAPALAQTVRPVIVEYQGRRVHGKFDGDTHFPPFDAGSWKLVASEPGPSTPPAPSVTFEVYERNDSVRAGRQDLSGGQ